MTTAESSREWLTEGAEVTIYAGGRGGDDARTSTGTVEKILAASIKVATAHGVRRFRRSDLREIGNQSQWKATPRLAAPGDPDVAEAKRRSRARAAAYGLSTAVSQNPMHGSDADDLLRQAEAIRAAADKACTELRRLVGE